MLWPLYLLCGIHNLYGLYGCITYYGLYSCTASRLRGTSLNTYYGLYTHCTLCVQAYNVAGFFVSIVPSLIYATLVATPRDCTMLGPLLLQAVGYICAVTLCKSAMSVAQSSAALLWRSQLTQHIHARYVAPRRALPPAA